MSKINFQGEKLETYGSPTLKDRLRNLAKRSYDAAKEYHDKAPERQQRRFENRERDLRDREQEMKILKVKNEIRSLKKTGNTGLFFGTSSHDTRQRKGKKSNPYKNYEIGKSYLFGRM